MTRIFSLPCIFVFLFGLTLQSDAQNWSIVITDNAAGTPANQLNGMPGGTALLYASIFNYTGTSASDDGNGNPVSATLLDFAGFGFTLFPGQTDLESRFSSDPQVPGWPQVAGSTDGVTPGMSGYVTLGAFNLDGLAPGIYTEDFTAGAYADDINSSVVFGDIQGTLTVNVMPSITPEPSQSVLLAAIVCAIVLVATGRVRLARNIN